MTTLFDIIYGACTKAGQVDLRTATGGSTTTAVCSGLATDYTAATDLVGSPLFIVNTTDGLTPQGEAQGVSSYNQSNGTLTVPSAFGATVASGDIIGVGKPAFPWLVLVELANQVLRDMGTIDLIDTSITTAVNQTEYTLPLALKLAPPKLIEVQGITTDANDNRYWRLLNDWEVKPAAGGSTGLLVLPQFAAGYLVKITYSAIHPAVRTATGSINDNVHPSMLTEMLIKAMMRWRYNKSPNADQAAVNQLNAAEQSAMNAMKEYKPKKQRRVARGFPWGRYKYAYSDDNYPQEYLP